MPIPKMPDFSPNVAARVLKEHGLEGKVSAEALAEAAQKHDAKPDARSPGYLSADELALGAKDLQRSLGGPADGQMTPVPGAPVHSPLFARGAVIDTRPRADMSDPALKTAKERILANVGDGARFGALDGGEGLRAFTVDDATLGRVDDPALKDKLAEVGGGKVFGVLTTDDEPALTLASVVRGQAHVLAKYELLDDGVARILGGERDALKAAAELFGAAPVIELGGENPSWQLGRSDWSAGDALAAKLSRRQANVDAREAARKARRDAAAAALLGPTTIEAFRAAGAVGHEHTAAEKKALLALVKKNAGEDKTFPDPDESYYGLHAFLLEGAAAAHAAAFAQASGNGAMPVDLDKHSVLVTVKSFDEAQLGVYVVDRAAGKVLSGGEDNTVDYDADVVKRFFPSASLDDDYAAHVIGTLTKRGELLGVVAGKDAPDDMDFTGWGGR